MNQLTLPMPERRFDGDTYSPEQDCERLTGSLLKVYEAMQDGQWQTLRSIARHAGCSEAGASARLRDLRKPKFGGHTIERERLTYTAIWQYRLVQQERAVA